MIRTQIQIPDELYRQAKEVAGEREWSLAELCRRGLEYMVNVCPSVGADETKWNIPEAMPLGGGDPFTNSDWREQAHIPEMKERKVAEDKAEWGEAGE